MHTRECTSDGAGGTSIAQSQSLIRRLRRRGRLAVVAAFIATACSTEHLTDSSKHKEFGARPEMDLAACTGCLQDNFTDVDGKPLGSHVPDGGTVPFSWQLTNSDPTEGQIRNNAVGYDQGGGWIYVTSIDAGDTAELEVDVFGEPVIQTDVGLILRANPASPTFYKGYTITWSIYGSGLGSDISIDRQDTNLLFQTFTTTPTSTGLHTLKAEILPGGVIKVYVDGVLGATATDPNPLPLGRAGMSLFNGGTPSFVRITSFVAAPGCPPTGDPVMDDPNNLAKFDSSFQASNPNGPQTDRKEHIRAGYEFPDGHVESVDLNPPFATNCGIDSLSIPLTNGEGKLAWIWHSHPYFPFELVSQCGGEVLNPAKEYVGVPSGPDWKALDIINNTLFANGEPAIPGYIYDKKRWYRMNPNIPGQVPHNQWISGNRSACR